MCATRSKKRAGGKAECARTARQQCRQTRRRHDGADRRDGDGHRSGPRRAAQFRVALTGLLSHCGGAWLVTAREMPRRDASADARVAIRTICSVFCRRCATKLVPFVAFGTRSHAFTANEPGNAVQRCSASGKHRDMPNAPRHRGALARALLCRSAEALVLFALTSTATRKGTPWPLCAGPRSAPASASPLELYLIIEGTRCMPSNHGTLTC